MLVTLSLVMCFAGSAGESMAGVRRECQNQGPHCLWGVCVGIASKALCGLSGGCSPGKGLVPMPHDVGLQPILCLVHGGRRGGLQPQLRPPPLKPWKPWWLFCFPEHLGKISASYPQEETRLERTLNTIKPA